MSFFLASFCLLVTACTPTQLGDSVRSPPGDSEPWDSELETTPGDSAVEQIPDHGEDDHGCSSLYDQGRLQHFELEIDPEEWNGILADYASGTKEYHPAVFVYHNATGGEIRVEDAAVRLRGNPGFSWLGEKMQFVISFNENDPDGRFRGLRKISLDASWYDPSVLRDRVAYAYMRRLGLAASCANSAKLTINGSYYGLYKNVEYVDHEFLERAFGDELAAGVLWKYGTTPTANEDQASQTLITAWWSDSSVENQDALSDLEYNLLMWAAEVVTPQNDGYWCCAHNFYVYEHPERKLMFVPWDLDYSLDATPYWADPWTWYRGGDATHFDQAVTDPGWRPVFLESMRQAVDAFDPAVLEAWVREWAEQIDEAFREDPHHAFTQTEHEQAVERLATYVHARHGWTDAWTRCQMGQDTDADGDGHGACTDCDDTDASIHPGASESCNGRDDDCNGYTDDSPDCDSCHEHAFDSTMLVCWYPRSWEAARVDCQAHGGDLGFPRSTEDWYAFFIHAYWHEHYWNGTYFWWGGATDAAQEGSWVSTRGNSVASVASWASGEPSGGEAEDCLAMYPNGFTWYDARCEVELPYLCTLE